MCAGRGKGSALARGCRHQSDPLFSLGSFIYLSGMPFFITQCPRFFPGDSRLPFPRRTRVWPHPMQFSFTDSSLVSALAGPPETCSPPDSRRGWAGAAWDGPSGPQGPFSSRCHEMYPFRQNEPRVLGGPAVEMTEVL